MKQLPYVIAAAALIAFVVLALGDITTTSPTSDEPVHLASGWSYWKTHDYRLNPEHPPLVKMIAAVPLLSTTWQPSASANEMWRLAMTNASAEWFFAHRLFYALRGRAPGDVPPTESVPRTDYVYDSDALFHRARTTLLIVFGLTLGIIIFCWTRDLFGPWGAALAVSLFAFDPNFIAHSGLVTTDVPITCLIAATIYFFWRWMRNATKLNAILFVIFFALAFVAKFSAVVLLIIVPLLAIRRPRAFALIGIAVVATFAMIWAAYGFRFAATEQPLPLRGTVDEWYAKKEILRRGETPTDAGLARAAARTPVGFLGEAIFFAHDHKLLPEAYLYGFAQVESGAYLRTSYLRGDASMSGFRSYFFWTFVTKTPIATLIAIVCALAIAWRTRRFEWFLLTPAAIYLVISLGADLNIGHRHILPIYPFLYILCGILGMRFFAAAAAAALSCFVVFAPLDPMWGRHLSYFNELAGGPTRGWRTLSDSNIDWGQDLPRLASWLREHDADKQPVNMSYFGPADPHFYGIRYVNLPGGYYAAPESNDLVKPGYLAVSVSDYSGATMAVGQTTAWQQTVANLHGELVGRAGYSILIFRIR